MFLRSAIFNFFYVFWTVFVGLIFWPVVFFPRNIIILVVGKIWARGLYFFLKNICKLEYRGEIKPRSKPAIYASKHQSALETFMFHLLVHKPVFILKKELLNIPVFGYYLKKMGMISIDRAGGMKSLKQMLKEVQEKIQAGYSIIIFPEGTRTKPGEEVDYNSGILAIYNLKAAEIIPVALNTGCFWPKNSFLKKPGKFSIEFLDPIPEDLDKKLFIDEIKNRIETRSKQLIS